MSPKTNMFIFSMLQCLVVLCIVTLNQVPVIQTGYTQGVICLYKALYKISSSMKL